MAGRAVAQRATPMMRPSTQPVQPLEQSTWAQAPRTSVIWMGRPPPSVATTAPLGSGAAHACIPCGGTVWVGAKADATGCDGCAGCPLSGVYVDAAGVGLEKLGVGSVDAGVSKLWAGSVDAAASTTEAGVSPGA